ncbi:hypothetical protein P2318_33970 [Myxococcaceae bacterium GXIMD 01537]
MSNWTLSLVALGCTVAAADPVETRKEPAKSAQAAPVALKLQKPDCDPVKELRCVCVGTVGSAGPALREVGLDPEVVRTSGAPCIPGDFDKDGQPDYAFPGAEYAACNGSAPARVIFTRDGAVREVQQLPRRVSCFQLYRPNKKPGMHGVPPTDRDALVDWGEGNNTWFYVYDGKTKTWKATTHASESN